ncbi:hypothetical protein Tco_1503371 [Tanacetum coccineum]
MEQRRHGFTSMLLPWEFCARLSSTFGPNGPATSHIVGLCILAIQDDVAVRRMEEIDVDVLYEAWKRIEITKRIGAATRVRACSHVVLYDADAVGETYTQSSGKEISMNEMVGITTRFVLAAIGGFGLPFYLVHTCKIRAPPFSTLYEGGDPRKKVGVFSGKCDMYMCGRG